MNNENGTPEDWNRRYRSALSHTLALLAGAKIPTPEKGYGEEPWCLVGDVGMLRRQRDEATDRLAKIADVLETAVCTEGIDKGVILLSDDGPTHTETVNGRPMQVYDHEYFSPLGDTLIEAWHLAKGTE